MGVSARRKFAKLEKFFRAIEDEDAQMAARQLIDVAKVNRCQIETHPKSVTVSAPCGMRNNELVEVARIFVQPGSHWYRAKEFSFGIPRYKELSEELSPIFQEWVESFRGDGIFADNTGESMLAWVVTHADAADNQEKLASHFEDLVKRVAGSVD